MGPNQSNKKKQEPKPSSKSAKTNPEKDKVISKLPSPEQIKPKVKGKEASPSPSSSLPSPSPTSTEVSVVDKPAVEGLVPLGGGLPALPARPPPPVRQAMPSASTAASMGIPNRVPNLKQVSKPQFNLPPGSDLGSVGKIGAIQLKHTSSAANIHANIYFWIYLLTFIVTCVMMKKK